MKIRSVAVLGAGAVGAYFVYGLTGKACFGILSIILLFLLGFVFLTRGKPYFRQAEHAAVSE